MKAMKLGGLSRRRAVISAALAAPAMGQRPARAASPLKIGFVSPQTGPLAAFGEPTSFVLAQVRAALKDGLLVGGQRRDVVILLRDSQSSASRAAAVTADLINTDNVDLLVAASAPDTVNPVADQAEANQVPCLTTDCPWQPWFFGRKGDPKVGFTYSWHFFWGLEDVETAYIDMWNTLPTNRIVGGLFPNDADGNAWGDKNFGFPGILPPHGYKLVDTGRFTPGTADYSSQIAAFKAAGCEIVTGNLTPPDFATFYTQAGQQNFHPKIVTIGKALLFPSAVAALGARGEGLSTEVWWTPRHPFRSGLTGQTPAQLCAAYTAATGRPWTQPLGYKHALFEVAIDVLRRSASGKPADIVAAIAATNYAAIVGPVRWTGQPVKNVAKTPLVAGQWHTHGNSFDLAVAENATAPQIPLDRPLAPIS
jgi:branched-chain amino acid transport system substrate-binding protein